MRPAPLLTVACALALIAGCGTSTSGNGQAASVRPEPSASSATVAAPTSSAAPATSRATTTRPASSSRATTSSPPPVTTVTATRPPALPSIAAGTTTVVLNPGHNGGNGSHSAEISRLVPAGYGEKKACDTTGTTTNAGYPEHAFTWDLALRVRGILQSHGVRVILTRPNDTGVGPCVDERAAIGNSSSVTAVVSLHADGAPSSGHGFHVNQDSRRPDGATAAVAHRSIVLGEAIHAALVSSSGLVPSTYIGQNGYYYRSDLAGLNLARRPATFLELGNMRNSGDAALLSSGSGRARIARAVAAGILAYLGR